MLNGKTRRSRNQRATQPSRFQLRGDVEKLENRYVLTTANLSIFINGTEISIPDDIGTDSGGNAISQVRSLDASGTIEFDALDPQPLIPATLGDFFETWRTNAGEAGNNLNAALSSTQLMGSLANADSTVQMLVNGQTSSEFENYILQENDDIVLVYGNNPVVSLNTNFGPLIFELFENEAPRTVNNFLNYVNDGDYVDTFFHRSVRNFVIQGGGFSTDSTTFTSTDQFTRIPTDPPIENEFGIANTRGTIAMAKTSDPDSATSQFFVNLSDNASLDSPANSGGFTVFGQVLGMGTADDIAALPIDSSNPGTFNELPLAADDTLVVIESVDGLGDITGVKFTDSNRDGVFDDNESAIVGATVFVDANGNGTLDSGEITAVTDDDGRYLLQVEPGTHTVATVVGDGASLTTPLVEPHSVTVQIGRAVEDIDFGEAVIAVDVIANDDSFQAANDLTQSTFDVLANDSVPDNSSIASVSQGDQGGVVEISGLLVRYTAPEGFVGTETFTYTLQAEDGSESTAEVTVDVRDFSIGSITGLVYLDTDGDSNQDDDEIGVPGVQITISGTDDEGELFEAIAITADDGTYQFDAVPPGTYTVTQNQPEAVNNGDDAADEFTDVTVTGGEETTVDDFIESDLKAEFISIVWFFASAGTQQSLFREALAIGEENIGNEDLAAAIRSGDPSGLELPSQANVAPVATDDTYSTAHNTELSVEADQGVLSNDTDENGDDLSAEVVDEPQNGTLVLDADGSFVYTPNDGFDGDDTFTYTASDDEDVSNLATVTISVSAAGAPVAVDDAFNVDEDGSLDVDPENGVLANDSDPQDDALTVSVVETTTNGVLSLSDDGSFTYTPDADFNGEDTFTYEVSDGSLSSTAQATITVAAVNDDPVAADDTFESNEDETLTVSVEEGVLSNDSDVDDDSLTVTVTQEPLTGTLTMNDDGSFTYEPEQDFAGTDSFTYEVSDGLGGTDNAEVTLNIRPVNDPPVASEDTYTTDEDTVLAIDALLGLLANDTDVEGNDLSASLFSQPSNGSVNITADGSFEYTPDADFSGTDSFEYVANDGSDDSEPATVTINVTEVDDPSTLILPSEFTDPNNVPSRNVGQLISFTAQVDDVDDSDYVFLLDLEDSMIPLAAAQPTINSTTGEFAWTPTVAGRFELRIIVVNGDGEANQETFLIDVL